MKTRQTKFVATLVSALAAVTMIGGGSAAAKTPPAQPAPLVSDVAASSDGADTGAKPTNGVVKHSFKPRK